VREYLAFHSARYDTLLATLRALPAPKTVLDVGTFLQTEMLRRQWPDALVHTTGEAWTTEGWGRVRDGERHFAFDLNDLQFPDRRPQVGPVDLVVMAEVIEHLYTAPAVVLSAVRDWLAPAGRVLVQTPNAARLEARLRLLRGRHPYEMIRPERENPGHFRELTVGELRAVAAEAGFTVESLTVSNYFGLTSPRRRAVKRATALLGPTLRDGITAVLCA
jgi:SAM-dependent methyltransferase